MADVASSTHKRKASSPEAPNTSSSSSSDKHDSKKARKETTSEKQHAEDCEDPDCEGCAEGEIVLQFDSKPSAVELFQMAREEVSKGSSEGAGAVGSLSRMAKALFDKAIEEFEILEKAEAHIELNDGTEVAGKVLETRVQHAACVVAVGNAVPSTEMLQEGTRMFEELLRKTKGSENGNVLVGLGIAQISQARDQRGKAMKAMMVLAEDEEEEPSEEQRDAAVLVGKAELELANQGLASFDKGLKLLKAKPESAFAQESIRAAQELEEYGISMDLKVNHELAVRVFDRAIQHLEDAQQVNADLVDSNADVLSIYGSCLHSKARLVDNQSQSEDNPAKAYVEKAIELLVKAEELQDEDGDAKTLEALGQAYLMSTGFIVDEDVMMERFDAATEKLSRALDLDPSNEALREQVEALQGDEDGEGFADEDGDEEEGDFEVDEEEDEEE
ncbi:hypothetical protein BGZ96_005635 [Linnemannia gamsii]|uniref:Tetratricopeptide SHNi-TPR domain-containing protein n=1 Tax=Linnemannia gamsii TaxID=64522 RepID=A0ABQ7K3R4_9FUNG|nr:hypothetical protein BGZ96_005635 [Linnemannia gamsii]